MYRRPPKELMRTTTEYERAFSIGYLNEVARDAKKNMPKRRTPRL